MRCACGKGTADWDPGATGFAADQFLGWLSSGTGSRRVHLLKVTQGIDELPDQPEVRTQPPEQQKQEQTYQGDNYQVLQTTFPPFMGRPVIWDVCESSRPRGS